MTDASDRGCKDPRWGLCIARSHAAGSGLPVFALTRALLLWPAPPSFYFAVLVIPPRATETEAGRVAGGGRRGGLLEQHRPAMMLAHGAVPRIRSWPCLIMICATPFSPFSPNTHVPPSSRTLKQNQLIRERPGLSWCRSNVLTKTDMLRIKAPGPAFLVASLGRKRRRHYLPISSQPVEAEKYFSCA